MSNFGSFSDLSSLFTKLSQSLGKRPKTWTGTKAEWDQMTTEQKAAYDGWYVNFTDDAEEGGGGAGGGVRYDSETGYIQYTPDNGTTWINLINTSNPVQIIPTMTSNSNPLGVITSDSFTDTYAVKANEMYQFFADSYNSLRMIGPEAGSVTMTFYEKHYIEYLKINAVHGQGSDQFRMDYSLDGATWVNGAIQTATTTKTSYVQYVQNYVKAIRFTKTTTQYSPNFGQFEAWG